MWFSLMWYILKSESCTLQSFKTRTFFGTILEFGIAMETFHPQSLGHRCLPFPWLSLGWSQAVTECAHCPPMSLPLQCLPCSYNNLSAVLKGAAGESVVIALLWDVELSKQKTAGHRWSSPAYIKGPGFLTAVSKVRSDSVQGKPLMMTNTGLYLWRQCPNGRYKCFLWTLKG